MKRRHSCLRSTFSWFTYYDLDEPIHVDRLASSSLSLKTTVIIRSQGYPGQKSV